MKGGVGAATSEVIAISRVLCILCVVYAHTPPYETQLPLSFPGYDAAIWIVREILGRSSVPLLSIVSGYLAARLANEGGFRRTLRRKVLTLLLPLLLWNLIALTKDVIFSLGDAMPAIASLPRLLFGTDGEPRLTPLYFLRDVFVCSLLAPLLRGALRHGRWLLMPALFASAIWDLDGPLFISGTIALFYTFGLGLGDRHWSTAVIQHPRLWWAVSAATLVLLAALPLLAGRSPAWPFADTAGQTLLILRRVAAALLFWLTAAAIARRPAVASTFTSLEPIIFFIFCAHPLIIGLAWSAIEPATRLLGPGSALAAFLLAPLIVLSIGYMAIWGLRLAAPGLLRPLMAGKVLSDRQMTAALRPLLSIVRRLAEPRTPGQNRA